MTRKLDNRTFCSAVAVVAIMIIVLAACTSHHDEFSDYRNLSDSGWAYGDTLVFVPIESDSIATGLLRVGMRHADSYLYSNLWIEVAYPGENGGMVRDTLNIRLANAYGRWLGHGFGPSYQVLDTAATDITLRRGDRVSVRHIMRLDTVKGVEQIGLSFVAGENGQS